MNKAKNLDKALVNLMRQSYLPLSRIALFIIFFWFGVLKVFDLSPASPMVLELLDLTMPFIAPTLFLKLFGLFEMFIGTIFLIKGWEKFAILLLAVHLFTTVLPLFLMPAFTWQSFLVPTMEGQYIIKNLLIVAVAVGIVAHAEPQRN